MHGMERGCMVAGHRGFRSMGMAYMHTACMHNHKEHVGTWTDDSMMYWVGFTLAIQSYAQVQWDEMDIRFF